MAVINQQPTNQPQQQPQQQNQLRPQGTGFTNLSKYMQANQNNKLGQTVSSGIQKDTAAAKSNLQQAENQFGEESAKGKLGTDSDASRRQDLLNKAQGGTPLTQDEQNEWNRLRTGGYTGPNELNNVGALQAQGQDVQQLGQAVGNQGGRFGLLQRYLGGGPQYTAGQQRFDELLLGTTGGQQLNQARRGTVGFGNQVANQNAAAQQVGQSLTNQAQGFREGTQNQLQGATTGLQTTLEQRAAEAGKSLQDQYNTELQSIQSGTVNQALAQKLGLSGGQQLYGLNLQDYITAQGGPNAANVADTQQRAAASALASMGAQGTQPVIDVNAAQFDPNKTFDFNQQRFQADVASNKGAYDRQVSENTQNSMYNLNDSNQDAALRGITRNGSQYDSLKNAGYSIGKLADLARSNPGFAQMLTGKSAQDLINAADWAKNQGINSANKQFNTGRTLNVSG